LVFTKELERIGSHEYLKNFKESLIFIKEPNENRWFYGQFLTVSDCQRTAVIYQYWFFDNRWVEHIYQDDTQWVSVPHYKNHPTLVCTWTNVVPVLILLVEAADGGRSIHFSWNLLR
jgi:hypothetical protein